MRAEIASRYNGEAFRAINPSERRRVAEHETAALVLQLRREALASMDAIAQHQIGPALAAVAASKLLYSSSAMSLLRLTVDSDRRHGSPRTWPAPGRPSSGMPRSARSSPQTRSRPRRWLRW